MLPVLLIAVDVGNSQIKLGLFGAISGNAAEGVAYREPDATLKLNGRLPEFDRLAVWLQSEAMQNALAPGQTPDAAQRRILPSTLHWQIGSVNRPAASRLIDWLREHRPDDSIRLLDSGDLPLVVKLPRPDLVGIDRLLDAVATNRLRTPGRAAVVVDVGSAITVDLLDAAGAFCGGAILPGIAMSARALHEFTDLLPPIDMAELNEPPPALGSATVAAIRSGLFWGAVGSIRQLIEQLTVEQLTVEQLTSEQLTGEGLPPVSSDDTGTVPLRTADIFLTGGAGPVVAQLLGSTAQYVPHLTLAGIALAALHKKL